ncbi:hypothetical protein PT974_00192 [Cladobotryum mycophilum]|uniref:BTB domain-containing protein n=1 Tax=Cladobotryum mycophilum TaxID=491253 RepID=A0ABR0T059_9HYPO
MTTNIYAFDPNGDTLLTLRNSDKAFAVESPLKRWPKALPKYWTKDIEENEGQLGESPKTTHYHCPETQLRLSSKHLSLASSYFHKLTTNDWRETKAENGYSFTVSAEGWDNEALRIVMCIIHGQTTELPRVVSLEKLAKIAVIVDYYKCHGAVDFFAKTWICNLYDFPTSYGRNLLLRLLISWVFSEADTFQRLTEIIIRESRGPIHSLGLPIPEDVIDALETKRQTIVSGVISGLHNLKIRLCGTYEECSFQCSSISLGALVKGMAAMRLIDRPPKPPYEGYSFMAIKEAVCDIQAPNYHQMDHDTYKISRSEVLDSYDSEFDPHSCFLSAKLKPIIDTQSEKVSGLDLEDFINQDQRISYSLLLPAP